MRRVILCSLIFAATVWPQTGAAPGSQPSVLEAFARHENVRTIWSAEAGRIELNQTRLVITALVLADSARTVRGVKLNLSNENDRDEIYLDEEAIERTRKALIEIADGVRRSGLPRRNGCMGAAAFWPLYNWPWNQYHEMNADFCGTADGIELVLSARGKRQRFRFPGEQPGDLAAMLVVAIDKARQH